mmetsp:Transcript_21950/g.86039  ORF Transcript_21950/g.86039 Transcript_21950/m.86039 type:complete len:435 (-) Transcript_21950:995-2299(-)
MHRPAQRRQLPGGGAVVVRAVAAAQVGGDGDQVMQAALGLHDAGVAGVVLGGAGLVGVAHAGTGDARDPAGQRGRQGGAGQDLAELLAVQRTAQHGPARVTEQRRCAGRQPGRGWRVGVQTPHQAQGIPSGHLDLADARPRAVAPAAIGLGVGNLQARQALGAEQLVQLVVHLHAAHAADGTARVQVSHQGRGRVVAADGDHVPQPVGDGAGLAAPGPGQGPGATVLVHQPADAHGHHHLQQRGWVRRDEARAPAKPRRERQGLPAGAGLPADGGAGGIPQVGMEADVLDRAEAAGRPGDEALGQLAREQHIGRHRRAARREAGHGQVQARPLGHRAAVLQAVGRLLEMLGPHRVEQGLGEGVGGDHSVRPSSGSGDGRPLSSSATRLAVAKEKVKPSAPWPTLSHRPGTPLAPTMGAPLGVAGRRPAQGVARS